MSIKHRLPRKFTEEVWLPALRSGKYEQGIGELLCDPGDIFEDLDNPTAEEKTLLMTNKEYCCLGVAATLCGIPEHLLLGESFISKHSTSRKGRYLYEKALQCGYPEELISNGIRSPIINGETLVSKLADMNDSSCHTFEEIADFIENEVELYD